MPSSLPYEAFADLIIGARQEQQDSVRLLKMPCSNGPDELLMIVADGMGGHEGGAVASSVAVDAFEQAMIRNLVGDVSKRLALALEEANAAIRDAIWGNSELRGMGCTLVAVLLRGRQVQWISVGDSVLAEINEDGVHRLNADHSFAPLLDAQVARREITAQEAAASQQRHVLRSALTGGQIALIDEGCRGLTAGALVVAASDGVHTLQDSSLAEASRNARSPEMFVASVLAKITTSMESDQDNTAIAAARIPGAITRRIEEKAIEEVASASGHRLFPAKEFSVLLVILTLALFYFVN